MEDDEDAPDLDQNAEEDSDENDKKKNTMMTPNLTKTLNRRHRGIRLGSRNVMSLFSVKLSMVRNVFFPLDWV